MLWQVDLESDEEEQGCRVHQRVEDPNIDTREEEEVEVDPATNVPEGPTQCEEAI